MRPLTTILLILLGTFTAFAQIEVVPILHNPILQHHHSQLNAKNIEFRGGQKTMPVNFVEDGGTTTVCLDTFIISGIFGTATCLDCSSTTLGTATLNQLCLTYNANNGIDQQQEEVSIDVCTIDGDCTKFIYPFEIRMPFAVSNSTPFFDDFSYEGPYPDGFRWLDRDVFVNTTLAIDPPSVGCATFDGVDETGSPYGGGFGLSDQLTTNFIDFSNLSSGDRIYVSFHYQEKGCGYEPLTGDTLLVEARLADGSWSNLDAFLPGGSTTEFNLILRELQDPNFFHRGFQLRFKNYSRRQGAIEFWHLDYVAISTTLVSNGVYDDIAFTALPTPFLERYTSLPWKHFENFVDNETSDEYQVKITNHFSIENDVQNTKLNITETTTDTEVTDFVLVSGSQFNIPSGEFTTYNKTITSSIFSDMKSNLENDYPGATELSFQTTYAYNVGSEQESSADGVLRNDTVQSMTHFKNYFAYDDGSAERGIVAQNSSTRIAVQFHANVDDSIRAVQFHFPRVYNGTETQLFNMQVYVGELDDDPEYNLIFQTPYYVDSDYDSLQGFTNYSILDGNLNPAPIFVPAGDFYVGWQQVSGDATGIPVGLDKNNEDATQYGFFSVGSSWDSIPAGGQIDGAIMIRPVFGDMTPYNTPTSEIQSLDELEIYPNPSRDFLFIQNLPTEQMEYHILDSAGKVVGNGTLSGTIDISKLLNGMYFLHMRDAQNNITVRKFIKVN